MSVRWREAYQREAPGPYRHDPTDRGMSFEQSRRTEQGHVLLVLQKSRLVEVPDLLVRWPKSNGPGALSAGRREERHGRLQGVGGSRPAESAGRQHEAS